MENLNQERITVRLGSYSDQLQDMLNYYHNDLKNEDMNVSTLIRMGILLLHSQTVKGVNKGA